MKIIKSWFILPSMLYHELCHIVMLLLLYPFVTQVVWKECYLKMKVKKWQLHFDCIIRFDCNYTIINLLILSAPVIGFIAGLLFCMANWLPITTAYFAMEFFGITKFNMSPVDVKGFKQEWNFKETK